MDETYDERLRDAALDSLAAAWNDALGQGIPRELMVSIALALAYGELVSIYGRETAETIAARFPSQIRAGNFDVPSDDDA